MNDRIPLYAVPPIPPKSSRKVRTRDRSEELLSDGFPPIKTSIGPYDVEGNKRLWKGLGSKNILNLKEPARTLKVRFNPIPRY